jgi:zinc transport system ATP-binding protein
MGIDPQHELHPPGFAAAVEYRGVSFAYSARAADGPSVPVLSDVTLSVSHRERLGILGPNGGGKSTLLKLTLGLLKPTHGTIRVLGREPSAARAEGLVAYVPQKSGAEPAFPISARQAVLQAATLHLPPWKRTDAESLRRAEWALSLVGASEYADRHAGSLSGGQLQRVWIARALANRPRLLLLDEPTVGIDPAGQQQFSDLLARLRNEMDLTILVVSHDLRTVAAGCDRVACLARTLHFHDAPGGLTPAVLAEVFRHDVSAIFGDVHIDAHRAVECSHHHAPAGSAGGDREGGKAP